MKKNCDYEVFSANKKMAEQHIEWEPKLNILTTVLETPHMTEITKIIISSQDYQPIRTNTERIIQGIKTNKEFNYYNGEINFNNGEKIIWFKGKKYENAQLLFTLPMIAEHNKIHISDSYCINIILQDIKSVIKTDVTKIGELRYETRTPVRCSANYSKEDLLLELYYDKSRNYSIRRR